MMRILGISGSPRAGGNTECLINECLAEFKGNGWETAEFFMSNKTVRPCEGCDYCRTTGVCAITADDAALLFGEMERADAIIIGSPAYYRNVTAQLKAAFDRMYAHGKRLLTGKPGGAIAVGAGEGGGQAIVLTVIYNFMLSCGGLPVPGEMNGLTARADKPGDILTQPKRLEQACVLARNVMKYTELLRGGKR